jgi:tRNA G10  N-methylase Trm11
MHTDKWNNFKNNSPYKKAEFAKRNWGTSLHSLCSYQGKIKPALAHHLIDVFSSSGDKVSDPFSGSGTIPLEASIAGRIPIANDLSDMAVALTLAKVGETSHKDCEKILVEFEDWLSKKSPSQRSISEASEISFNKNISEYFEEKTFLDILKARDFFLDTKALNDANWCLVFASMLHILHGNRPYALSRNSHPLTPYAPTGDFVRKDVSLHLRKKVNSALSSKQMLLLQSDYEVLQTDVIEIYKSQKNVADCIITSPPFASSTRFYMTNWMRFWFSGWSLKDFNATEKAFIESKKSKNLEIYEDIFRSLKGTLKLGGTLVLHVGKNKKVDMGAKLISNQYEDFKLIDHFTENVEGSEKHGIKDKGGTVEHQYLVYQRV